jgi:EAL domain-containing protein (putative c-di-GMP-specific phosphodiesterase class I)
VHACDRDHAIVTRVPDALARSGLPASAPTLELTESTLMDDIDRTRMALDKLKDLGTTIAVDDFGTGYSSLADARARPHTKTWATTTTSRPPSSDAWISGR